MKRRHLLLVALSLIISVCMCLALAGCGSCDKKSNPTQLETPVVLIADDGKASWTADENASGYAYKINGGEEQATDKTSVMLTDKQSIVVKAKGDGKNYSDSEWSQVKTYTKPADTRTQLSKPAININGSGLATWSVQNAVSYLIKLDGGTAQDTNDTSKQLELGQTIQVQAIANSATHKDSPWSDVAAYTIKLDKPVISIEDGLATWSVEHAEKYSVIVNDRAAVETEDEEWGLEVGDTIQVQALGDGKYYTDSDWSAVATCSAGGTHECQDKCPDGKCTSDCQEPECQDKCKENHDTTHECEHKCPDGKCTSDCQEPECQDKCKENHDTTHECEHKCPDGKCTSDCQEPECQDKCKENHDTTHECEHKCPDGKCTSDCTEPECQDKCKENHDTTHECEHKCPDGKCTSNCQEPECATKCTENHNPPHVCENECSVCHGCTSDCQEPECATKCECDDNGDDDVVISSHTQYLAAAKGATITVKGVVTGITANSVYFQDLSNVGGYLLFGTSSGLPAGIVNGAVIVVTGKIDIYNGVRELTNATEVKVVGTAEVEPVNITSLFTAGTTLSDTKLTNMQGALVTVDGAVLSSISGDNGNLTVNGISLLLYFGGKNQVTAVDLNGVKGVFSNNVGKSATVTGYVSIYNDAIQLIPAVDAIDVDENGASTLPIPVVDVDDKTGLASWYVENAVAYVIEINGTALPQTADNTTVTYQLNDGDTIRVKAIGDGVNYNDSPDWSAAVTYHKVDVVFDFSSIKSSNGTSATATHFTNACGNGENFVGASSFTNAYAEGGSIRLGSSNNTGSFTLTFSKKVASVIINCALYNNDTGSTLTVTGATGGAQTVQSAKTNLTFTLNVPTETIVITSGTKRCNIYKISVIFAEETTTLDEKELGLDISKDGKATWNDLSGKGATKYVYTLNEDPTEYEVAIDGTLEVQLQDGDTIHLKAIGDGKLVLDSKVVSKTYERDKLNKPVLSKDKLGNISWTVDENAQSYKYSINGNTAVEIKKDDFQGDTVTVNVTADKATIEVWAIGDHVFYNDSDPATIDYERDKLDAPVLKVDKYGKVTWVDVDNAENGYKYVITKNGVAEEEQTATDNTVTLEDGWKVEVWAVGDGSRWADSDHAEVTYILVTEPQTTRPALELEQETGKVIILNAVTHATAYIYETKAKDSDQWVAGATIKVEDISAYPYEVYTLTEDTPSIRVRAVGDKVYVFPADVWAELSYNAPNAVAEPVLEVAYNGTVTWSHADGAVKNFKYYVGEVGQTLTDEVLSALPDGEGGWTATSGNGLAEPLKDGQAVAVIACGYDTHTKDSGYSIVTYKAPNKHGAVSDVTFSITAQGVTISWTAPAGEGLKYTIKLNDSEHKANIATTTVTVPLDNYSKIEIIVNGNGAEGNSATGDYSNVYEASDPVDATQAFKTAYEQYQAELAAARDAQLVKDIKDALEAARESGQIPEEVTVDTTIDFYTFVPADHDAVEIIYTLVDAEQHETFATLADSVLTIKPDLADEDVTITIRITLSLNAANAEVTFTINVVPPVEYTETTDTIDFNGFSAPASLPGATLNGEKNVATFVFAAGTGQAPVYQSNQVRFYSNNTLTVSANGFKITKIVLTLDTGYTTSGFTVNSGSMPDNTWTGEATTVTITNPISKQARVSKIEVTYLDAPLTSQEKVNKVAESLTAPAPTETDDDYYWYDLPLTDELNYGTVITWTVTGLEGDDEYDNKDGSLMVVRRNDKAEIKIKATVTLKGKTATSEEFTLTIAAKGASTEPEKKEESLYKLDPPSGGSNSNYGSSGTVELNGISWTVFGNMSITGWGFGGKSITDTDRKLVGNTAISGQVTQVKLSLKLKDDKITVNSVTLNVTPTTGTGYTKSTTYASDITFTPGDGENWTNCKFEIVFNVTCGSSNTYVAFNSLEFMGYKL